MTEPNDLTLPFPEPPVSMLQAVALLQVMRRGDPDEMDAHGIDPDTALPRPWEPASCPADMRREVWRWCHDVVEWINHEYVWRPQHLIPACWPRHAHIAREVPVVAYLRWAAEGALSAEATEEWQRYTCPMFFERVSKRLGPSGCLNGTHQAWPAAQRFTSGNVLSAAI